MGQRKVSRARGRVVLVAFALLGLMTRAPRAHADDAFLRGDVNSDGVTSLSDSLMLWDWLFHGERPPICMDAADLDDRGVVNIHDHIRILSFLFSAECHPGPKLLECATPAAPFPAPGVDPTSDDDLSCDVYEVAPPVRTNDLIRLGRAEGAPGQTVEIPVLVTSARDSVGFQLVIRYDREVFTPHTGGLLGEADGPVSLEGTYYTDIDQEEWPELALGSDSGDDYFVVGFIPGIVGDAYALPSGSEVLAFKIRGRISSSAQPGELTFLEPTNGLGDEGLGPARLHNEVTHRQDSRFVSVRPRVAGTLLQIVSDQTFFRGDSNRDLTVNTSDPIHTLVTLFTEKGGFTCRDAADANDDGSINLSDATFLLSFLFQRGASPPPPYREAGVDPTPDSLDCARGISG